ncbi:hypothetical protein [Thermococcus sp.]|uniref:hypothetical protein n=1 Tax=Thermococcus sp. TaxID=35749 RepID=UPI00260AE598|nr:hypothetical protein [Thermococcus sp.]
MKWWKLLTLIFVFSLTLSALAASFGMAYWSPLKGRMHAEIRLDNFESLMKFGRAVDRNVTYSFDVFWPMKPGKTSLSVGLAGVACGSENYTVTVVTMNGREFRGSGPQRFTFNRRDPFLYFHVHLVIPNSCRIVPRRNGQAVVIDAEVG